MRDVIVFFPDGKFHCKAMEVPSLWELIKDGVCLNCERKGAIVWNPYNKIHQCHHCGQAYVEEQKEKVLFT